MAARKVGRNLARSDIVDNAARLDRAGHLMTIGARNPPSKVVPFSPRNGECLQLVKKGLGAVIVGEDHAER